jgi:hypothetical protein
MVKHHNPRHPSLRRHTAASTRKFGEQSRILDAIFILVQFSLPHVDLAFARQTWLAPKIARAERSRRLSRTGLPSHFKI